MSESPLAAQELKSFVRRIEALDDEIRALNADKSDVFKEARGSGFDVKVLRKVIAARRLDAAERDEADTIFDLYWSAIHGPQGDIGKTISSLVRAHVETPREFPSAAADARDRRGRAAATVTEHHEGIPTAAADTQSVTAAVPVASEPAARSSDESAAPHTEPALVVKTEGAAGEGASSATATLPATLAADLPPAGEAPVTRASSATQVHARSA